MFELYNYNIIFTFCTKDICIFDREREREWERERERENWKNDFKCYKYIKQDDIIVKSIFYIYYQKLKK